MTYSGIVTGRSFPVDHNAQSNLIGVGDAVGLCQCNGTGKIVATHVLSGPYDHQQTTGAGRAAIYGKDGWYIAESETIDCPMCSGDKDELVHHFVEACGVPLSDRAKNFSYYDDKPGASSMVDTMIKVTADLPGCTGFITLFGNSRAGKTTAAQIAVLSACRSGVNALYVTAQEIVYGIKGTWGRADVNEQEYIDSLSIPRLLVIDNIHMVSGKDLDHVKAVIDMRYRIIESAMTIMISGPNIKRDEYLYSRMRGGLRIPVT